MSLTLTTVVDGTLLTAAAVEDYIAKIERYGNEGVANADLDTAPWVNSVHIFKPEFYGSPSPRTQLVSGMAHYFRKSDNLYQDDTQLAHTGRRLYGSGSTPTTEAETVLGALVARKQICMSESLAFTTGVHSCGVRLSVMPIVTTGALDDWKHVFVLQRNFVVDYHLR